MFGVVRIAVVGPIPLLLTPFIIKHVGIQGLGVWAVFLAINGLTSLADLGFFSTLTKHISEYFTKQDYPQLNRIINAGLVMFLLLAVLCALSLHLATARLVTVFFQQAPVPLTELRDALHFLVTAIAFNILAFPFSSVITGLQRLDFTNLLSGLNSITTAILAALFLAMGLGIRGLAYSIILSSAITLILSILVAKRLLPEFKVAPSIVRAADLRDLSSFSIKMYLTQIAVLVQNQTEKLLLAHFSGLASAARYDVANDLSTKMRAIPSLLLSPLLPATVELEARRDDRTSLELYYRSQKYLAFIGILIVLLTGLMAHRFVELWLGRSFSASATALIVLTVVQIINLSSGPGLFLLIAKGILGPGVRSAMLGTIVNLVLSTVLIIFFGFAGAVYGTALSVSLATGYFVVMFHRESGYPLAKFLVPYLKPFAWALLLATITRLAVPVGQLRWFGMAVTAAAVATAYVAGLALLQYFDAFDLRALERLSPNQKLLRRVLRVA
jgi:O-antigen/teichoic acid export membrane protein